MPDTPKVSCGAMTFFFFLLLLFSSVARRIPHKGGTVYDQTDELKFRSFWTRCSLDMRDFIYHLVFSTSSGRRNLSHIFNFSFQ